MLAVETDELVGQSWLFGSPGWVDWLGVLVLLAFGAFYLLAPSFGYEARSRGLLGSALWVMLARLGVGVLRMTVLSFEVIDGNRAPSTRSGASLYAVFALVEAGLFLLGLLLFVVGLAALRRETPPIVTEFDRSRFNDRERERPREPERDRGH
jgi:hypothetical protein